MGFLGVYKAVYDYAPQAEGELQITEGDILYVLEKSADDDWWKAKKKTSAEEEDEPEGLIPNNYIEEAQPVGHARALYEYTRQTDEELSFPEDAQLQVFDTSDPDWILVGHDGDYGFVPANYIDVGDGDGQAQEPEEEAEPPLPARPSLPPRLPSDAASPPLPPRDLPAEPVSPAAPNPAAALAGVLGGRSASSARPPPAALQLPPRTALQYDEPEEEVQSPPLPTRPRGESRGSRDQDYRSPTSPETYSPRSPQDAEPHRPNLTPGGFHMFNINEMVSVMGKKKKMPTTLGVNLKTGVILIAPERSQDGPSQEWSADRMTHYSREGKHVFVELVRPSKSVDFHAGAKDTAEDIVAALGELAGAVRAEGLKEVLMASTSKTQNKGVMLYDFMAQGDDEVTVAVGDEVIIIDDATSDEWWQVRRLKNNKEGVVPSSYIDVTGSVAAPATSATSGINAGRSTVEQNRLEEERLTKEAVKAAAREDQKEREKRHSEVGPGMRLPERNSSLSARDSNSGGQQRRRENGRSEASGSSRSNKSKPDPTKVRNWTDRSKSFSVEAQFLGVRDGKLNLHKMNGVKIAVPIAKMSVEDLEYVERLTGMSFDEDKPLSDLKKRSTEAKKSESKSRAGASIQPPSKKVDYDWFQFFLTCEVPVGLCERYAQAFSRDSMDESVLPDVDAAILRNLGLKEGDIIKVMRYLDNRYGRNKKGGEEGEGGLFSGPGGTLRNNTRKGRPAPPVETNNKVDLNAFSQKDGTAKEDAPASPSSGTPTPAAAPAAKPSSGFDDDAWDVKPAKTRTPEPQAAARTPEPVAAAAPPVAAPAPKPVQQITPGMAELSLLTQPLEPEKVQQPPAPLPTLNLAPMPAPAPAQIPQPTGANPAFFSGMAPPSVNGQQFNQLPQQLARQRPVAPQYTQGQGGLIAPPPSRPLSAPQSAQPSAFTPPPLQPQMTGYQQQIAPPGQSLNEITQQRLQQQYAQQMQQQQMQQPMMPMMTGMPQQGFPQPNQFMPQPTGFPNGQMQSPFADPSRGQQFSPVQMQPTGFPGGFGQPPQQFPQQTGVNTFLPPALEPQRTGMPPQQQLQPQPTGMGFGGFGPQPAGLNNQMGGGMQPMQPMQPLIPQQTGPPPPVRFGVQDQNKLAPQPTGRRANLAAATPQNPFGF
ncbi:hypothetical protein GQ53DRAFT_96091 [Thozetella sp. PMI_491]|nr:hypothetical protein GQ53DRAFT_96091 [Thozetella sp. PMI_491]